MKLFILLLLTSLLCTACPTDSLPDILDIFKDTDRILPELSEYEIADRERIRLTFSEAVVINTAEIDGHTAEYVMNDSYSFTVRSPFPLSLSEESELFLIVSDERGNTASFILPVAGRNNDIPRLLINEFSSRGSDSQPERIELLVMEDGNIEGVYAADGTKGNEVFGFTLPSIEVRRGDLIVIYWNIKPKLESFTNRSGTTTYNIYAAATSGLPDNNGVFVIYNSKTGKADVLDALIYSDFNSSTYSGFGSARVEAAAEELMADFSWFGQAFNCRSCTTTRSINRNLSGQDTDRAADFFICETRGQSFGEYNRSGEYTEGST